jgi:hypothetical protein
VIKSIIGCSDTVSSWLESLDKSQKDAFVHYAKNATSDIESYLYARFLKPGYNGSIADLTAWVQEKYPKQDLRKVLLIEIDAISDDIKNVRDMTTTGMLDFATAATKISALQKELRSHIQAVRSITDGLDRRGLLLADLGRRRRYFGLVYVRARREELIYFSHTLHNLFYRAPKYPHKCVVDS